MRNLLPAPEPTEAELLKQRIDDLERELADAKEKYEAEREERVAALRKSPEVQRLYQMLRLLFDGAGMSQASTDGNQPIPRSAFDPWKARLSPSCGKIIDALLVQPLSHKQIITFCKMNYYTARDALAVLSANKLVERDGETYRLKP